MGLFLGKNHRLLLIALLTLTFPKLTGADESRALPFRIIVNTNNPISSIDRRSLAQIFLKKTVFWPGSDSSSEKIQPVDLAPESPVRRQFSDLILSRSVTGVKNYWQQAIFSGRDLPPPEFTQDEDVVSYVQNHEGSIGYVSSHASVRDVKVLPVK